MTYIRTAVSSALVVVAAIAGLACGGKAALVEPGTGGTAGTAGASGSGGQEDAGGSGGASGSGGQTGGAGGSGGTVQDSGPAPECTTDQGCVLVDSCCDCVAWPSTEKPPSCSMPECYASACAANAWYTSEPKCVNGTCILGVPCAGIVACNALPPECPPGQVPSMSADASCWGGCVPANQCAFVESCEVCAAQQFACMTTNGQAHCVPFAPD